MTELPGFVCDTNVYVSRMLANQSTAAQALRLAFVRFVPVFSSATLDELRTVLHRKKFDRRILPDERTLFLDLISRIATLVEVTEPVQACRDQKDDMVLSAAVAGRARLILTGDDDLLALHPFRGIAILSPRQFLDRVGSLGAIPKKS